MSCIYTDVILARGNPYRHYVVVSGQHDNSIFDRLVRSYKATFKLRNFQAYLQAHSVPVSCNTCSFSIGPVKSQKGRGMLVSLAMHPQSYQ